jgi:predicted Zn-dependent protease
MFKTHPAPGERLDALSEKMQPVLDTYSAQPQLADRFVRQIKK